jgi:putative sugar O-methyltransferase
MPSPNPDRIAYLDQLCHHASPRGIPPAALYLEETPACTEDVLVCERILRAFHSALLHESTNISNISRPVGGIWGHIKASCYEELARALQANDAQSLARLFRNGLRNKITFGFDGICSIDFTFDAFSAGSELSGRMVKIMVDRLVALSEAIGLLPYENPEHGRWGENLYTDLNLLVLRINAEMGYDVGMPKVFGMFGLEVAGRILAIRTPDYLYAAWKMKRTMGVPPSSIVEIGAGLGGVAYYSVLGGAKRYSIVDLPYVNTMQAFFLIKALGGDKVRLFGEEACGQEVEVLPYWSLHEMEDASADLCYNQDSLPEIREDLALDILKEIARVTTGGFYSVNQEGETEMGYLNGSRQLLTPKLMERNGLFERRQRNIYWIRKGFVEEFYTVR